MTYAEEEWDEIDFDEALTLVKDALPAAVATSIRDFMLEVLEQARDTVERDCHIDPHEREIGGLKDVARAVVAYLQTEGRIL